MGLSLGHLLVLAVILILFGGKRLPALATALGQSLNAFKKAIAKDESKNDDQGNGGIG